MWNKTIDVDLLEECFMQNLAELEKDYNFELGAKASIEQALWDAISSCMDLSGTEEE